MDASLPEFVLLFVIGLIVLGPERLAQVARKLGHFVGYARRMSRNLQTQLEDELEMKRIRESLPKRVDLREQLGIADIEKDLKSLADDVEGKKKPAPKPTPIPPPNAPEAASEPDDEGTEHNEIDWEAWEREGSGDGAQSQADVDDAAPDLPDPADAGRSGQADQKTASERKTGDAGAS